MKRSIYKKSALETLRVAALPILFTLVVMAIVVSGLYNAEMSSRAEGLRTLEESLRRAVVKNYAIEGRYPQSVAQIEENFGIYIDSRYIVHYRIVGANLFPEIMVIERSD